MIRPSMFKNAKASGLAGAVLLTGCAGGDFPSPVPPATRTTVAGGVGLALTVSDGSGVDSIHYDISRDGTSVRTGELLIGVDGRVTGTVAGLDPGQGYRVDFRAPRTRTTEGVVAPCEGFAAFAVESDQTTPLSVLLQCDDTSPQGTVIIGGTLNFCPRITCASAMPNTQVVGESVQLSASAEDKDKDPLTFTWSAGAVFSEDTVFAKGANVTYTCEAPGTYYLNVRVCDRGPTGCQISLAQPIAVTCTAPVEPAQQDCGVASAPSGHK